MNKQELLTFFNGYELRIRDMIVLIKDGKGYSDGTEVTVTINDLRYALALEAGTL